MDNCCLWGKTFNLLTFSDEEKRYLKLDKGQHSSCSAVDNRARRRLTPTVSVTVLEGGVRTREATGQQASRSKGKADDGEIGASATAAAARLEGA